MTKRKHQSSNKYDQYRIAAENDLETFIRLVHPNRVLGHVHKEVINWWVRPDSKSHQLLLLPRDHQKSALVAYRVAWEITRNPAVRILYISSTSGLAVKQLKFIKDILTCDAYRTLWPEMVNEEESKREKWTETEISVDHPLRKAEFIRDPTVFTAGLTTNIVGMHCDIAVLDDVVVDKNAYTEDGRAKTADQVSSLASITGTDSQIWAVGTRYHPKDIYDRFVNQIYETYDDEGNATGSHYLWEVYQREVEDRGDGTGKFLWPRQQRGDGKWFGFNAEELSKKRAQYEDKIKFRSQYYNDPNDLENATITEDMFQYYKREALKRISGFWYINNKRINVFASIDFAFSLKKAADYTCIAVVGMDADRNYYVLDIDRFKTQKISEYFDRLLKLHVKWDFRKVNAEISVAQEIIVKDIKNNYIKPHGLSLTILEHRPIAGDGKKWERIEASLQPKYANGQIFHYYGGDCQTLEEELVRRNPPHDDCKDALTSCIDICVPPTKHTMYGNNSTELKKSTKYANSRFGGISA